MYVCVYMDNEYVYTLNMVTIFGEVCMMGDSQNHKCLTFIAWKYFLM